MPSLMHLKILLPFQIFADRADVAAIEAHGTSGSVGFLPQRLDCVMALAAGVLNYTTGKGETVYVAVDRGVLVKTGSEVLVSVRNAIGGADLGNLHEAVRREFLTIDSQERDRRVVMAKLETGLLRRMAEFPHGS
ncbi:F-type H+-transporting ATPase subunit epsilon [Oxalobacteraceae bacterium GrIS 1.18]